MSLKVYYDPERVGSRIRKVRKHAGVSQEELAEEMSISADMLSRIENGRNSCMKILTYS